MVPDIYIYIYIWAGQCWKWDRAFYFLATKYKTTSIHEGAGWSHLPYRHVDKSMSFLCLVQCATNDDIVFT